MIDGTSVSFKIVEVDQDVVDCALGISGFFPLELKEHDFKCAMVRVFGLAHSVRDYDLQYEAYVDIFNVRMCCIKRDFDGIKILSVWIFLRDNEVIELIDTLDVVVVYFF